MYWIMYVSLKNEGTALLAEKQSQIGGHLRENGGNLFQVKKFIISLIAPLRPKT